MLHTSHSGGGGGLPNTAMANAVVSPTSPVSPIGLPSTAPHGTINTNAGMSDGMFGHLMMSGPSSVAHLPGIPNPYTNQSHDDNADAHETNQIIAKTVSRFHNQIMNATDSQLMGMENRLRDMQSRVVDLAKEKEGMGELVYKVSSEVGKLNTVLAATRHALQEAETDRKSLTKERMVTETQLQTMQSQLSRLQKDLESAQHQLQDQSTKIYNLQTINTSYTHDLKIHKRIHAKLVKELQVSDEKRKAVETELETQRHKIEVLNNEKLELKNVLDLQKSEALVAQKSIDTMHKEIQDLTMTKETTEKQWSEAITAMSKRDKTFQTVVDTKDKLATRALELETIVKSLQRDHEETVNSLTDKEKECRDLSHQLNETKSLNESLTRQIHYTETTLSQTVTTESMIRSQLEKLQRTDDLKTSQLNHKDDALSDLKSKLQSMRAQFDHDMKLHVPLDQALHRESMIQAQATHDIEAMSRIHSTTTTSLRKQAAMLQSKLHDTTAELNEMKRDKDTVDKRYKDMESHYTKLYEEAKRLVYALERREHDLSFLKAKISQKEADNTGTFNIVVSKLQKDVQDANAERDRLQELFLESQKTALASKDRITELESQLSFLRTQLTITDTVKTKTNADIDNMSREMFDQKLESSKLYTELRRLQPILDDLRTKNTMLEQQLHEARLQLQESDINSTTATHMLKTQIRRLTTHKQSLATDKTRDTVTLMNMSRKTELLTEMVDKLKSERYDLMKLNYSLRRRVEESEKRVNDVKLELKRVLEKQKLDKLKTGHGDGQLHAWGSLISVSNGGADGGDPSNTRAVGSVTDMSGSGDQQSSPNRDVKDLPDFESWRLKMDSLTKEKEYLITENKKLSKDLDAMAERVTKTERQLFDEKMKHRASERTQKHLNDQIKDLNMKYKRAEKVAAHMEQQIKEARPNYKIDYQMLGNPEPSTQLLAALLTRELTGMEHHPRGAKDTAGHGHATGKRGSEVAGGLASGEKNTSLPGNMSRRMSGLRA